ncbi:glutamate ABC transporter substrate-binding protein [Rhodococcus yunnanensis]|uniref:Glutamate ABC transporter substrate-binding protein n=1 Tax=Rhodococcoides yunnanense TaxID=278209 RepID=A0ABU4BFI2_9NOCA|nr:glutamate ABC transporter substrate-binding protein [Rhodococcus yunnanensis]MDV6262853.1 glutamate ABC transporter substrate-binding protein [Rhodococcus yunnanensis]
MATALLVGCTPAESSAPQVDTTFSEPPLPDGASVAARPTETSADDECARPTASLRPLPSGTDAPPVPQPTIDALRAKGRLVVGLDTGSNLFSFRDPMTGQLVGFDVDIAREISRDLFGDPNRLDFRILTSAQRLEALQDSSVDIVVKTMTITCARRKDVQFSTVYFQAQHRILVVQGSGIRGVGDLAGKRVCAVEGTTSLRRLQRVQPAATVVTVPMWSDCLVVLQQRQVDAVSTDDAILAGLAAQDPYLEIVGDSLSPEPYGVGINRDSEDLVRFVNGTLARIRSDGTWNRLYNRWLTVLGPSPGPPTASYSD